MSQSLPNLEHQPVTLLGSGEATQSGQVAYHVWDEKERRSRAFKKTFKVVGTVLLLSLSGLFVHILWIVIVPTLFLTAVLSFPLFFRFLGEKITFYYAEGTCPHCEKPQKLRPYLNSELKETITVQCPDCGETSRAKLNGEIPT